MRVTECSLFLAGDIPDVQNGTRNRIRVQRGLFGDVAIVPQAVETARRLEP